jgi:hypothetical protein
MKLAVMFGGSVAFLFFIAGAVYQVVNYQNLFSIYLCGFSLLMAAFIAYGLFRYSRSN